MSGRDAGSMRVGALRQLSALPRDAQDTLLVVLVAAASVAPLLPHLPLWVSAATVALLLWRALLAGSGRALPSRGLLAALLALAVAGTLLQFRSVFGRDPGVSLVSMLLALKLLEQAPSDAHKASRVPGTRQRRDAYVVFNLGLFCVFAQFLYTQSAPAATWMLLCTLGWITALLDANLPARRPPLARRLALGARLIGLGLPLTVALFVLFPRLAGPLWSLPDTHVAASGLPSSMDAGTIASLALSDSVAFRVHFDGPRPPQSAMYWRGPVLGHFDGTRWTALAPARSRDDASATLHDTGNRVRYTVTLQPTQRKFAFALDAPTGAPTLVGQPGTTLRVLPDLELRASSDLTRLTRYTASSWLHYRYGLDESAARLRELLQLPSGYDPRTVALGRQLRKRFGAGGARAGAGAALRMFRQQPFRYSLHPGRYSGPDSIDQFLFQRRVGFCEHYAQAFVVLMRAAGIPARIVTGYQGGSENPVDGMWVVRQSDAHAWAEYWVRGSGWVSADPTAMVDPARVDRSGQTLESREPLLGLAMLGRGDPRALRMLRDVSDALGETWNQWVLDYGQTRQRRLLSRLGLHRPGSAQLASASALSVTLALAAGALWLLLGRERARLDPWQRSYALLRRRLRRAGVQAGASEPPAALARRLRGAPGMDAVCELLLDLERARYGEPPAEVAQLRALRRLAARLPLPRDADDTAPRMPS